MNKKIFTLLAGSLMLFIAVFSTNAQTRPWVGDTVRFLPEGIGKGAYHLHISQVGLTPYTRTDPWVLGMNDYGYVGRDESKLGDSYETLRKLLWCVSVTPENYGQRPAYTFTNKEYGLDLAVTNAGFIQSAINSKANPATNGAAKFPFVLEQRVIDPSGAGNAQGNPNRVYSTGEYSAWEFSPTYNTTPLEINGYLRLELDDEADYYLTFGYNAGKLFLAKVHISDFDTDADFYNQYLVRFTLMNAAARVLNEDDFNTKLNESESGFQTLLFTPDVTPNQTNVLAQPLKAENVNNVPATGTPNDHYLRLKTKSNTYVYVSDEFHNLLGYHYPKIKDDGASKSTTSMVDQFRLVYYPSEDSIVINVREVINNPDIPNATGSAYDDAPYTLGQDVLYNRSIWNYLIIRTQNLDTEQKDRIITSYNVPTTTYMHFGIHNCEYVDPNRTTVKPDLYTVQDTQGRYLVVPMAAGDFTPQWRRLTVDDFDGTKDTVEVALKTPSYQWFVTKVHEDSETSRIFLTNREFDFIRLEYVQIYKEARTFAAQWRFVTDTLNPGATYTINDVTKVSVDGFKVVYDDKDAAAKKAELVKAYGTDLVGDAKHQVEKWMAHMPQNLMEKLYRTGPFLGYKAIMPDTLNYFGYAFHYLTKLSDEYYMGVTEENNAAGDTSIYVEPERTYFELNLPDSLRAYGRELYGLGHGANSIYQRYEHTKDIAPLERYFYHFKINDYYKYSWNDYFLVLDDGARYVYTDEATANSRKLNKAKFYMRFTYDKNNREYYTLLDRIDKSNFEYLTKNIGLNITDTLKSYDASHGAITNKSFGVIMATVNDRNRYVAARVKTLGAEAPATFALDQMEDELYRRFNTGLEECGRGEVADEPRTLKFYRYNSPNWFIYEDGHSGYVPPSSGIRFMGVENVTQCDVSGGQWHSYHNYAIYVDTAYVNRGTGHIKPQYMLVVDPKVATAGRGCNSCGDSIDFRPYVYGRYLRNMTDSARVGGVPKGTVLDKDYIWDGTWERLAFTEAIHLGDTLYVLNGTPIKNLYSKDRDGKEYLNIARFELFSNIKVVPLDNNLHKDEVFSMRFVERQRDKVGNPIEGAPKHFYLESETTNRDVTKGRMIAPQNGGWVKWENGVPVLSRGSFNDPKVQGELWDVSCAAVDEMPTGNDDIAAEKVVVVSGNGSVVVLNAEGRQVVITNVLGQTIANEVLTSDNATIQTPKGIVVVAVEGENAVKTIVK